jgi:superfamily II DNA or RNA helicase
MPKFDVAVTPRSYQLEAVDGVLSSLRKHRSTLVLLPVGSGKTTTFSLITKLGYDHDRNVLILVHRDELVKQAVGRLKKDVGIRASIEKAKSYCDPTAKVVVASVQTMTREARLKRFAPDAFNLIVCDEAHHFVSKSFKRVLEHFHSAKVVGVTATGDRHDQKNLYPLFEDIAYQMTIRQAIEDGWLVPVKQFFVRVKGLDYSQVRVVAGRLHQGDLESVVENADILERMVVPTIEHVGDRSAIVFCVSKAHAHACVEFFQKKGKTAVAIDEGTPKNIRSAVVESFRSGDIQYLCNVEIVTEGFDAPDTGAVVMFRPTESRTLYIQMAGRGMRPSPGVVDKYSTAKERCEAIASSKKPHATILDFVGNSGNHKLVHAASMLAPGADDAVIDTADTLVAENPQLDLIEAVDLAERLVEEARGRVVGDAYEHKALEVDAFGNADPCQTMLFFGIQRFDDPLGRRPTPKQLKALERFGIRDADMLNRREASALLDRLVTRAQEKQATVKQMQALVKAGYDRLSVINTSFAGAMKLLDERPVTDGQSRVLRRFGYTEAQLFSMTSREASRAIDEIKENGWRRPS